MKVDIVVPGKFHADLIFNVLYENNFNVKIYTSTPKSKWSSSIRPHVKFIPRPFQIIRKILKIKLPKFFADLDVLYFKLFVRLIKRNSDITYFFASTLFNTNGKVILDRACPHQLYQLKLLNDEEKKLGIKKSTLSENIHKSILNEYTIADKIVVPSTYTYQSFLDYGIDKNKLYITGLTGKKKQYLGKLDNIVQNDNLRVGLIGNGVVRKGYYHAFEALMKLENIEVVIKCSRKEISNYSTVYDKLKLLESSNVRVTILDYLKNISDFYNNIDVLLLPSVDEGFGMVVHEALAFGVIPIVSEHVGSKDILCHGFNGFILPVGNSMSIYSLISKLVSDRDVLNEMIPRTKLAFINSKESYEKSLLQLFKTL